MVIKTNKYYENMYLMKEISYQQKERDLPMTERESNVKARSLMCANKLIKSKIKNKLIDSECIESKEEIINYITTKYLNEMYDNDKFIEQLKNGFKHN